jgi:hypothetical protein
MIHEEDSESDDGGSGAGKSGQSGPDFGDRLVQQMFGDDAQQMGIG